MTNKVAVAGATGGIGRTIVEQILSNTEFEVIILTRRATLPKSLRDVPYVQVDYNDVPFLALELERLQVQTVICTIGMFGEDCAEAQLNLIRAASRAPSYESSFLANLGILPAKNPGVTWFIKAAELLKDSNLTYTRVVCGAFMDFLGTPHIRSNITPLPRFIDVLNRQAYIPGNGDDIISMTYSYDAAAFVAKLLDLNEWPEFSIFIGDKITFNEIVQIAEETCGQKFQVTYVGVDKALDVPLAIIPEGSDIRANELQDLNTLSVQLILGGVSQLPTYCPVNEQFPGLKPKTVRELFASAWEK